MVLEYIDGLSFKGLLQNAEPMQLNQVIDYGKTLCDILIYMHGRTPPVVHGDFTPDNLIVNQNGVLKLIDFTIAQQSDSTFTSIAAGKPSYMPPEQYRGLITTQSDIYAMGATLYYLLTGEDPEPLSCLHPTTLRAEIPISLDTIVAKCTALNTADRYQSAIQVRQAIDELK
jgi:serine/threonine-protein kinase